MNLGFAQFSSADSPGFSGFRSSKANCPRTRLRLRIQDLPSQATVRLLPWDTPPTITQVPIQASTQVRIYTNILSIPRISTQVRIQASTQFRIQTTTQVRTQVRTQTNTQVRIQTTTPVRIQAGTRARIHTTTQVRIQAIIQVRIQATTQVRIQATTRARTRTKTQAYTNIPGTLRTSTQKRTRTIVRDTHRAITPAHQTTWTRLSNLSTPPLNPPLRLSKTRDGALSWLPDRLM